MKLKKRISACICSVALAISCIPCGMSMDSSAAGEETVETLDSAITISSENISTDNNKNTAYNNPISSDFYCADPTSVEYNGRLYLIGTNDHEQFEAAGPDVDNTYEKIKSFLIFSTDDMVNWTYHGEINVGEIAPWITNSWAPSICSRVEDDGLTHFYLYFSNNGLGTGVITTTDLLGDWEDPLGKPLISSNTAGLSNCPNPFDPGVVIDDNGVGWLAFGGGTTSSSTTFMPGTSRIVKLGDDMISFASDFEEIPAPYFFEASELNYINGYYVYTYCSDWSDHSAEWPYDCDAPGGCGMVSMKTKTPLDSDSWEMMGETWVNPGQSGFDYSNNHTHMQKYNGKWYLFYHTLQLKRGMGITGSYRSMAVDEITVDENTATITKGGGTKKGNKTTNPTVPYTTNDAAELNNTADITYDFSEGKTPTVISNGTGSWISNRSVAFTETEETDDEEIVLNQTNIDSITYNITVTSVDMDTTLTMHPANKSGEDCDGTVDISGTGTYKITCDTKNTIGMTNMGYFTVCNDAQITFVVDTITLNGKYTIDISSELTNTREWADGLRNIWNGFSDGDKVYYSDYAELRYVKAKNAIELFAADQSSTSGGSNADLVDGKLSFSATVKGTGTMEVRLDDPTGEILTSIAFDTPNAFKKVVTDSVAAVGGTHDLYFVFSDGSIAMKNWSFSLDSDTPTVTTTTEATTTTTTEPATQELLGDVNNDNKVDIADIVALQKYLLNAGKLTNADQADINSDSKINGFDLSVLRQVVLSK